MIMPPGATDKHMFDLEAAAKKLEVLMKPKGTLHFRDVAAGKQSIDRQVTCNVELLRFQQ